MRSNLSGLGSVVVGMAVSGAIASSASAGLVDDFSRAFDTTAVTSTGVGQGLRVFPEVSGGLLGGQREIYAYQNRSRVWGTGNGTANVILGQATDLSGWTQDEQDENDVSRVVGKMSMNWGNPDSASRANLAGTSSFSMNVGAYTGAATSWTLSLTSGDAESGAYMYLTLSSSAISNGVLTFDVASMIDTGPMYDLDPLNWSDVSSISLSVTRSSADFGNPYSNVSFTISNFQYNAVPAPGAVALLGAAGLVGVRRRKA